MEANATFEGWAIVELFGHGKEAGFVKTEYYGTAAMFRVDIPELPESEITLKYPEYIGNKLIPAGSTVKREAVPGRSRLIGPSAIFALNPCTEQACRETLARMLPRPLQLVSLAEEQLLAVDWDSVADPVYDDTEDEPAL